MGRGHCRSGIGLDILDRRLFVRCPDISISSLLLSVNIFLASLVSVHELPTPITPVQTPLRLRIKPILCRILHTKHCIAALARRWRISTRGIHSIHCPHIPLCRACCIQIKPCNCAIPLTILPLCCIRWCTGHCSFVANNKAELLHRVRRSVEVEDRCGVCDEVVVATEVDVRGRHA
jgi:hypothetical protein